jgi:hypothetical protein
MTEEQAELEQIEETIDTVRQELMVVRKIHAIERQMLSRAIQALVGATGKPAGEVVSVLSDGLDEGYSQAVTEAYGASKVVKPEIKVPKLHLPY